MTTLKYIKQNIVELLIITLFAFIATAYLYDFPPPWPDESFIYSILKNFAQNNILGTSIYGSKFEGMDKTLFFFPPFYFLLTGSIFKIIGNSFFLLRLISVTYSITTLLFITLIIRKVIKNRYLQWITLFLIAFNPIYIRGSRIGRMDILVLLLASVAAYFFIRFIEGVRYNKIHTKDLIIVSITTGLASITHPMSIFIYVAVILMLMMVLKFRKFTLYTSKTSRIVTEPSA